MFFFTCVVTSIWIFINIWKCPRSKSFQFKLVIVIISVIIVATLTLGLWPRQGLTKLWAKSEAQESHFMLPGVWESVREWTSTLPNELSLWELGSIKTPKPSNRDCRGQNPLDWSVIYIIEKLLKLRCLKWARMTHLGNENTSYGQKKGQKSNCQFDSRPLKVRNRFDFLACMLRATYHWKDLKEGYNFAFNLTSIGSLHAKLWASKVTGVWKWESRDKMTFGCWPSGQTHSIL